MYVQPNVKENKDKLLYYLPVLILEGKDKPKQEAPTASDMKCDLFRKVVKYDIRRKSTIREVLRGGDGEGYK
jgi:hypothetical protein